MDFKIEIDNPEGILTWIGDSQSRVLMVPQKAAAYLFRNYTIKYGDLLNQLGLYSVGSIGRELEATFINLTTPDYLIQERGAGCSWDPTTGMTTNLTSISSSPWKVNAEMCPDVLWNSCLEKILGVGNDVTDFFSTPEGNALIVQMIYDINMSLGNSFFMMNNFGQHPTIDEVNAEQSYQAVTSASTWVRFMKNQKPIAGFYTLIDELAETEEHLNVDITNAMLSADKTKFVGDAKKFVDSIIEAAPYEFGILSDQLIYDGKGPIIKLSYSIFERFKEQNNVGCFCEANETALNLMFTGVDKKYMIGPNVLMYKGFWIVKDHAQQHFDRVTNTVTHRGLLVLPGNFGLAHDTTSLDQYSGMGLRVYQDLRPQEGGKLFLDTYGRVANAILNVKFLAGGSRSFIKN